MKTYKITLSNTDENITVGKQEINIRETELKLLGHIVDAASNKCKAIKEMNVCIDLLQTIDNVSDEDKHILCDEKDLKNFETGLAATAGARTPLWTKCRNLFKQLEKPEEVEVEVKKE
jgi:hypothetical protein